MKRFSRPATIGLLMLLCLTRLSNPLFAQEPDADTIIESIMATYGGVRLCKPCMPIAWKRLCKLMCIRKLPR